MSYQREKDMNKKFGENGEQEVDISRKSIHKQDPIVVHNSTHLSAS